VQNALVASSAIDLNASFAVAFAGRNKVCAEYREKWKN